MLCSISPGSTIYYLNEFLILYHFCDLRKNPVAVAAADLSRSLNLKIPGINHDQTSIGNGGAANKDYRHNICEISTYLKTIFTRLVFVFQTLLVFIPR